MTAKFCSECGSALAPAPARREARKVVTVVFTDLSGSTALGERLDAESLVRVLSAYFEAMRTVLERHGGTVAKFIGDAVMAVFGIPRVHEEDALRAVRAALEMRSALETFNEGLERDYGARLAIRTGVHTGEVFASVEDVGSSLALGDPVNTAARLEQAAGTGEILLGNETYRLVRDAVVVEPVEPVAAKGKAEPLRAWRLLEVRALVSGRARRTDTPLVGREAELATLLDAYASAVSERSCHVVCVVGAAGVGKSRLLAELVTRLGGEARVLVGRCLSYGEGITYWAIGEMVRSAAGIGEADGTEASRAKLARLMAGVPDGDLVAARVAELVGLADPVAGAEELPWALRRLWEALAAERPLVVVLDDLHWGEGGFFDLVEQVVSRSAGPMLVVGLARPELAEVRPGFADATGAAAVGLEPLGEEAVAAHLAHLLGEAELAAPVVTRLLASAGGNPLYVEELLTMLVEEGLVRSEDGRWVVSGDLATITLPPTISALLAARLDRLANPERLTVESASVVGQVFEASAVTSLVPAEVSAAMQAHFTALVGRELIAASAPSELDEVAYRFHHLLIRDAAYEGMAKGARAERHEAFATWLEVAAGERIGEFEAIMGHHLEQACRYLAELRPPTDADRSLARRAASWLARAGRRSLAQENVSATVNLLGRAADLLPADDPERLELLPELGAALTDASELERAEAVLTEATRRAAGSGNPRVQAYAAMRASRLRMSRQISGWAEWVQPEAERAIEIFTTLGDDRGLALASWELAHLHWSLGHAGQAASYNHQTARHARRAGDQAMVLLTLWGHSSVLMVDDTPTSEGLRRSEGILAECHGHQGAAARVTMDRAVITAMRGAFAGARALIAESRTILHDLGAHLDVVVVGQRAAEVELLAGEPAASDEEARRSFAALLAAGEHGDLLGFLAGQRAEALCALRRDEEALEMSELSEAIGGTAVDLGAQRVLQAVVRARRGELTDAVRIGRQAVELMAGTDFIGRRADALLRLAEVLTLAGRTGEAVPVLTEAIAAYDTKENLVMAARARAQLAAIQS